MVRQGPWKLIRRFEERPNEYEGLHELFNLDDDLSEATNLARKHPEKVAELNKLIDQFLRETNALTPKPNPEYKPKSSSAPINVDPAHGLVSRGCKIEVEAGSLRVISDGKSAFLGTAQIKHASPMTLKLRMRSSTAGTGKIHWKLTDQDDFPANDQLVEYKCSAGSVWQDITVLLPITAQTAIFRLYMPQGSELTEFESITYTDQVTQKTIHTWKFD